MNTWAARGWTSQAKYLGTRSGTKSIQIANHAAAAAPSRPQTLCSLDGLMTPPRSMDRWSGRPVTRRLYDAVGHAMSPIRNRRFEAKAAPRPVDCRDDGLASPALAAAVGDPARCPDRRRRRLPVH